MMTEQTENREQLKEMRLGSGEIVIDRPDSHLHEGLGDLLDQALAKINADGRNFIESEIDFGYEIGQASLVETSDQDIIVYAQRPKRAGLTRFAKGRTEEPCQRMTVVLKKGTQNQVPGDYYVILTAYIGYMTPSEPWNEKDFTARPNPDEAREKAKAFWSNHALVFGSQPTIPDTETDVCPW